MESSQLQVLKVDISLTMKNSKMKELTFYEMERLQFITKEQELSMY